jgi:hypothetical protein
MKQKLEPFRHSQNAVRLRALPATGRQKPGSNAAKTS